MDFIRERWPIWREVLVGPAWRWLVVAPLALLGAFQAIREELSSSWQASLQLQRFWDWPWWIWVIAALAVSIVIILESAYQAITRHRNEARVETKQPAPGSVGIRDAGQRTRTRGNLFIGTGIGVDVVDSAQDHESEGNLHLPDHLQQSMLVAGKQLTDQELDEECQRLKGDLLSFIGERREPFRRPNKDTWEQDVAESIRYSDETKQLYLERFASRIKWLLEELRARGYYNDRINVYNEVAFVQTHTLQETAIFFGAWLEGRTRKKD